MNKQEKCDWMVYVSCATFNHATYIVDAMNGFTIQETNFPYVCAIIDDASTDGEQEVIKNYLNEHFDLEGKNVAQHEETDDYVLTFARHKTNLNCHFVVLYLKYNHYSIKKSKVPYIAQWRDKAKYIAICEGDDYWIDPYLLQRRVVFLEEHDDYSAIGENGLIDYIDSGISKAFNNDKSCDVTIPELVENRRFPTSGVLYRNAYFKELLETAHFTYDTLIWCWMASKGKFRYSSIISSVYRKGSHGMVLGTEKYLWAQINERWSNELIRLFGNKYYDPKVSKESIWVHYSSVIIFYKCNFLRKDVRESYKKCFQYHFWETIIHPLNISIRNVIKSIAI